MGWREYISPLVWENLRIPQEECLWGGGSVPPGTVASAT